MLELPLPYFTSTTTGDCAYWLPAAGGRLEAAAGYTDDDGRRPGLLAAAAGGPVG